MIKQFLPQESCLKCRGCCRFSQENSVWAPCLLDEEVQDFLERKIPSASISMDRRLRLIPNPNQQGFICPFLDVSDSKCKIYEFRPFECQLYPFLINLRGKKLILTIDLHCPYARENLKNKGFKEYTEYLASFLNSAKQIRIIKDNPQIIQDYEEVLDVVELENFDEIK